MKMGYLDQKERKKSRCQLLAQHITLLESCPGQNLAAGSDNNHTAGTSVF